MPDPRRWFIFRAAPDDVGSRLDVFLADQEDPPISRSQVKRRIDRGEVTVNGVQQKAGYLLRADDEVRWSFVPTPSLSAAPEAIPLTLLYEDDDVAIVDKPAGMVVHPSPGHPSGTLVNAIVHHFEHLAGTDDTLRPGIVHRLDKDTSGALAVTKTARAHRHLSDLFATHAIERTYHAIVATQRLPDSGTFDTLHARHPRDRLRFSSNVTQGRRAVTHFRVLQRFARDAALVECRLETGRTHQIRMHLSEAHAPLFGDAVYAPDRVGQHRAIGRQALHALTLGFTHLNGESLLVEAPYPEDFQAALDYFSGA